MHQNLRRDILQFRFSASTYQIFWFTDLGQNLGIWIFKGFCDVMIYNKKFRVPVSGIELLKLLKFPYWWEPPYWCTSCCRYEVPFGPYLRMGAGCQDISLVIEGSELSAPPPPLGRGERLETESIIKGQWSQTFWCNEASEKPKRMELRELFDWWIQGGTGGLMYLEKAWKAIMPSPHLALCPFSKWLFLSYILL